jgi:hypothetical protein
MQLTVVLKQDDIGIIQFWMNVFPGHQVPAFFAFHGQKSGIICKVNVYHIDAVIVTKEMGLPWAKLDIVLLVPGDHGDAVTGQDHEKQKMDDKKRPPADAGCFDGRMQLHGHAATGGVDK